MAREPYSYSKYLRIRVFRDCDAGMMTRDVATESGASELSPALQSLQFSFKNK